MFISRCHFLLLAFASLLIWYASDSSAWSSSLARRELLVRSLSGAFLTSSVPVTAATDELPSFIRPFTKLVPIGSPQNFSQKSFRLPLTELASRLSRDLVHGASNQGGYFLTGDLSVDIFRDDCVFVDPTNQVSSLSQYQNALRVLFDPSQSTVEIISPLQVDESARTISGTIRSRGVLQFPWHPRVKAYESSILYRVGEDGLIYEQSQTWSKSASEALRESFTPTLFAPPPQSPFASSSDEPVEVTKLFDYLNGRRPTDYSQEECFEIARLIDAVVDKRYAWKRDLLPGKWILAYLQPGPKGGGIDRRIPFPELSFNDNYQIFTSNSITNIGEMFGP